MTAGIGGHSLCKDDGKSTLPRAVLYKKLRTAGGASAKRCQPDATVSEFCIRTPNCSEALRSLGRTNQPAALSQPDGSFEILKILYWLISFSAPQSPA